MKAKPKKCKNPECREVFTPRYSTLQQACSPQCARAVAKIREDKKWRKRKKEMKQELMTHKDWVNKLVPVFNQYIRIRDKNQPCISCGCVLGKKYDAGHCFPAGHYSNIRFHEDNVHAQCVECNQHKHGNQAEYLLRLPDRIGEVSFARLLEARNQDVKYSIPELKAMIIKYKEKIKMLRK